MKLELLLLYCYPDEKYGLARAVYHLIYEDNQTVFGGYMIEAGDGGYFLTGTKVIQFDPVEMGDITLIRTDVSGQVVWENT